MDCLDLGVPEHQCGRVRDYSRLMAAVGPGGWGVVKWRAYCHTYVAHEPPIAALPAYAVLQGAGGVCFLDIAGNATGPKMGRFFLLQRMDRRAMAASLSIDEARELLERVRIENEADLAHAREAITRAAEDGSGTENLTDEMTAARYMESDASSILEAIAAATSRIESGTYGRCEVCGGAIAEERLRLRPYVSTCINCAEKK